MLTYPDSASTTVCLSCRHKAKRCDPADLPEPTKRRGAKSAQEAVEVESEVEKRPGAGTSRGASAQAGGSRRSQAPKSAAGQEPVRPSMAADDVWQAYLADVIDCANKTLCTVALEVRGLRHELRKDWRIRAEQWKREQRKAGESESEVEEEEVFRELPPLGETKELHKELKGRLDETKRKNPLGKK